MQQLHSPGYGSSVEVPGQGSRFSAPVLLRSAVACISLTLARLAATHRRSCFNSGFVRPADKAIIEIRMSTSIALSDCSELSSRPSIHSSRTSGSSLASIAGLAASHKATCNRWVPGDGGSPPHVSRQNFAQLSHSPHRPLPSACLLSSLFTLGCRLIALFSTRGQPAFARCLSSYPV